MSCPWVNRARTTRPGGRRGTRGAAQRSRPRTSASCRCRPSASRSTTSWLASLPSPRRTALDARPIVRVKLREMDEANERLFLRLAEHASRPASRESSVDEERTVVPTGQIEPPLLAHPARPRPPRLPPPPLPPRYLDAGPRVPPRRLTPPPPPLGGVVPRDRPFSVRLAPGGVDDTARVAAAVSGGTSAGAAAAGPWAPTCGFVRAPSG